MGPSDISVVPTGSGHCQCPVQIISDPDFLVLGSLLPASACCTPNTCSLSQKTALGLLYLVQEYLEVSSWGGLQP